MRQRLRLLTLHTIGALLRSRRRSFPPVRRILVIKPDHLGDVLLLTPALRVLRGAYPDARITLLIGPWSTAAVAHNPDIDEIQTCAFPGFTRTAKSGPLQPYALLLKTALLLRADRYDTALISRDDHWWGALLATLAGIPRRIGFAVPEVAPLLSEALPHTFAAHVGDQNLALVSALTGQPADRSAALRAPCDEHDDSWVATWLADRGIDDLRPIFAIHPGAGGAAKLWVEARWATIAAFLAQHGHVVLTGGPAERDLIDGIVQHLDHAPHLLIGEASIGQLTALYRRCSLVLGVDSGPLHLAVSADVPTIALFGPGDDSRFGPWGDPQRQIVVRSGLWCSPCGVMDACPRGTAPSECMAHISTQQVLAAIHRQFDRAARWS